MRIAQGQNFKQDFNFNQAEANSNSRRYCGLKLYTSLPFNLLQKGYQTSATWNSYNTFMTMNTSRKLSVIQVVCCIYTDGYLLSLIFIVIRSPAQEPLHTLPWKQSSFSTFFSFLSSSFPLTQRSKLADICRYTIPELLFCSWTSYWHLSICNKSIYLFFQFLTVFRFWCVTALLNFHFEHCFILYTISYLHFCTGCTPLQCSYKNCIQLSQQLALG